MPFFQKGSKAFYVTLSNAIIKIFKIHFKNNSNKKKTFYFRFKLFLFNNSFYIPLQNYYFINILPPFLYNFNFVKINFEVY